MIQLQKRLLILCERIHKPFVLHHIALLVSGLIALILGGAVLLAGHGPFVTRLTKGPVSTIMYIAAQVSIQ